MSEYNAPSTAVREMPEEDRPRERLARLGPEALRDAELIAVLIRTGTREAGAVALGDRLLRHFVDLRGVAQASLEEIQQVPGFGKVKAIEVKAALELGKRLGFLQRAARVKITCAKDAAEYLMPLFREYEVEHLKCLLLNPKREVLKLVEISRGSADGTGALPRDIFRQAVRENATGVLVAHNHPSGNPEPSAADVQITKRLKETSAIIGIELVDHIILGDGRYVSLAERKLL